MFVYSFKINRNVTLLHDSGNKLKSTMFLCSIHIKCQTGFLFNISILTKPKALHLNQQPSDVWYAQIHYYERKNLYNFRQIYQWFDVTIRSRQLKVMVQTFNKTTYKRLLVHLQFYIHKCKYI